MLTVDEAIEAILNYIEVASVNYIALQDCLNWVLAKDLTTPHDSPPFDKSMMDGFAVATSGFGTDGDRTLSVLETITAGTVPTKAVDVESASRIMTGALLPAGADCVVPIESVTFNEANPEFVTVNLADISAGRNILRKGVSAQANESLMKAGTLLEPQHIAVLAEFGIASVPTFRRTTVAVLATGDELLPIDQPLEPGRIRNSNEPMLVCQIQRTQAIPIPLGVAKDLREELAPKIKQGLKCDFLLLSGGVSAGTHDLVPSELAAAGVEQVFHKIQMKPGKPLWFGQLKTRDHTCWVFGLPGNPVSSMICFELFVRTAIRKFSGRINAMPQFLSGKLTQPVTVKGDRVTYFPSRLELTQDGIQATPVPWGGSADLRSTAEANGMCLLAPKDVAYEAGDAVETIAW